MPKIERDGLMFTMNHLIWVLIVLAVVVVAMKYLHQHQVPLEKLLNVCCVIALISEFVKTFSVMRMVPTADGSMYYPYISMSHLPLHLCSIQIILIFYVRFSSNTKMRETLLAFMYPSCLLGALMAIALPSIFNDSVAVSEAFIHPLAYQFFLYHAMLIVLGLYIFTSKQVELKPKHYGSTIAILVLMAFVSLYVNSLVAAPVYVNGELQSVEYAANMFFTYIPVLPIPLTEIWHWYIYLLVIVVLALTLIGVAYIPVWKRAKKQN